MSDHKKEKKAAVTSAVAVATVTSMMVGGLFDTPKELLEGELSSPDPIVRDAADLGLDGGGDDDDLEEDDTQDEEDKKRGGVRSLLRARLLRLPLAVRMLVILPTWAVGSLLLTGGTALLSALSPVLDKVLGAVLLCVLLIGAFLLCVKTIFPDLPLKKILNRKTLPLLVGAAAVLALLDLVLPMVWTDYGEWKRAAGAIGFLCALTGVTWSFVIGEQRERNRALERQKAAFRRRELVFTDPAGTFTIPIRWPKETEKED